MVPTTVRFVIPLVFPVIFFVVTVFIIFVASQATTKKKQALQRLSSVLPGTIPRFSLMPSFCGQYQGLPISIMLISGGEHSPERLKIELKKGTLFKLKIYAENPLTLFGERLGIIREVMTGDELFDRQFLIFSDKPQHARAYFANSSMKEALRRLFNRGFDSFVANGRKIVIYKPNYNMEDLDSSRIVVSLQDLLLLVRGM